MADSSGMQEIRGINIDRVAKGFADEALVLKKFVTVSKTNARQMRWYQKTAGFLDSVDTTGITASQIANMAERAIPVVVEQSWTRQTSYVRKYFVESPLMSIEDIKDCDIDILATNVRDLVKAVANQVDIRILAILGDTLGTGGNVNTAAAVGNGWDDATNGNPVTDITNGQEEIRKYRYDVNDCVLYMHPTDYAHLVQWLISVKGSSIPGFSSEKVRTGVVMEILGCKVVVSANMSADTVVMFVPKRACTWKQFTGISSAVIDDPGIGKKIRVWEEGEAILTDPRAVHVITDTIT